MYKRVGAQDGENMAAVAYKISRSLINGPVYIQASDISYSRPWMEHSGNHVLPDIIRGEVISLSGDHVFLPQLGPEDKLGILVV